MERILVTGGAGFVGSHLCKRLLRSDAHVVALDNLSTGNVGNLGQDIKNPRLDLIVGDIHSRKTLQRVLRKCDLVYHLAANSDVRNGIHDTKVDFEQNLVATKVILECMKESETCRRLVFASTSTVYGEPSQIPTPETYGPLKPISLYGASKLGCEAMISAYGHLFDIESTIFRLANVIGPQSSHGVVYDVTKQMSKRSNSVEILGNGKQRKSYLYIDDCIEALFMAYKWHEHQTETFNLGSNDSIQVNDIVRIINGTMGCKTPSMIKFRNIGDGRGWPGDVKEMLLDCSKLMSRGWKPRYGSQMAIELTVRRILNLGKLPSIPIVEKLSA